MSVDMVYSHVSRFRPQGGSETAINYNGWVAVIIPQRAPFLKRETGRDCIVKAPGAWYNRRYKKARMERLQDEAGNRH